MHTLSNDANGNNETCLYIGIINLRLYCEINI